MAYRMPAAASLSPHRIIQFSQINSLHGKTQSINREGSYLSNAHKTGRVAVLPASSLKCVFRHLQATSQQAYSSSILRHREITCC
ncbi:hypothetical protein Amal_03850 [Acetobacter malorum]|uniref:Uncharacterized protein n=1 Tax=Acetobacter malorum TaxID=178901 RepID=A0A177G3Q3_9PROT|nr:hypothetical protein Amal_03850 [Acetobacter malorum]